MFDGLSDTVRCSLIVGSGDMTVGELRASLANGPIYLTPKMAEDMFGIYRKRTWSEWCSEGIVAEAWQDAVGGTWRFPVASAEAVIAQKRNGTTSKRRGLRGPRTQQASSST